jgi:hypothetical protein
MASGTPARSSARLPGLLVRLYESVATVDLFDPGRSQRIHSEREPLRRLTGNVRLCGLPEYIGAPLVGWSDEVRVSGPSLPSGRSGLGHPAGADWEVEGGPSEPSTVSDEAAPLTAPGGGG